MARLTKFLKNLLRLIFFTIAIASILFTVQSIWHVFTPIITYVDQDVNLATSTLSVQVMTGVSIAALVLFFVFLAIAILHRGINNRQFVSSFFRNILSSVIFVVSDWAFSTLQKQGRFYLLLALVLTLIITIILIEMVAKASNQKAEISMRTDLMSSVTAGLAFGLILATGQFTWGWVKHFIP
ncbi:MAG: hypothetical protein HKM05_09170 [Spirochaetales bacterium]|nr:hypothetical protein [Spirochaetales bacterium]